MSLVLLWLALAWADPPATPLPLDDLTTRIWERGERMEQAGDALAAASAYRIVQRENPTWVPATLALGRVYEQAGNVDGAREVYRRSRVPEVMVAAARLELELGETTEALRLLARVRRADPSAEVVLLQAQAEAQAHPLVAAERLREWLRWLAEDPPLDDGPTLRTQHAAAVRQVVTSLVDAGEDELAVELLGDVLTARPQLHDVDELGDWLDSLQLDAQARQWMRSGAVPLEAEQRRRLDAVEEQLRAGELETARTEAQRLTEEVPRAPQAWATLARVALAQGDVAQADEALQRAEFLAPTDAHYAAALGDLLATSYAGTQDAAAVEAYGRALRRDPLWAELWWRRARVEQRSGLGDRGRAALERYVELEPDGEHHEEARRLLRDLERERPPAPPPPAEPEPPPGVSYEALLAYHRVGVLRARGEREEALHEVRRVRALAPDFADAVNLEASLFLDVQDREHAISAYQQSLRLDPNQPSVVLTLWDLLRREGRADEAQAVIDEAEARGIGDVYYLLARAAWDEGHPALAREHLDAFAASATTGRFAELAAELEELLDRRDRRIRLGLLALVLTLLGGGLTWPLLRWWRGPGVDLAGLLAHAPGLSREVVNTAAAVRHEVLKHDATVLFEVADALEDGDVDKATWAADRLFGPRGTVARFDEHVERLQTLARSQGVRLDLRRRDAVMGPLLAAMRRLQKLEPDLRRGRARAAEPLRRVATDLTVVGFAAVGRLVQSLSVLEVDEDLLASMAERVSSPDEAVHLEVRGPVPPVRVRLFQGELEDLVANLVRNAVAVSAESGATRVLLCARVELDELTYLERLRLAVCDQVARPLTVEQIRERPVDRGLGIAREIVQRAGGSMAVEPESGWSKAVVAWLPVVEAAEESP